MQENLKLFDKIPYEVRIIKGSFLSAAQAEEAINDVLSDTSAFFKTPTLSEILKVKSDNVYGVFKLIVTVAQGTQYPEYMLNARVAELEPKLVNVIFETAELEETEEFTPLQNIDISQPIEHAKGQGLNIIAQASTQLGVTYKELAELIGYETTEVVEALSSGVVNQAMKKALELYMENAALKQELEDANKFKTALKEWLK